MGDLERKIHGCWLGKAIGGTLGMPHEGKPGPLNLDFYDPVPDGCLPNDDLDLQLVWIHALRQRGDHPLNADLLARAWKEHVEFPWDEYGVCLRNYAYGLRAPALGAYDNWFGECMGAAIRSEIWACLAPGDPQRAAGLAYMDAVCDHAGDGIWAEIYLAAIESLAFVENDTDRLLDASLALLPPESRVRIAIEETRRSWNESHDWRAVMDMIYARHRRPNFTDVAANLAITILGFLAGERDFGRSICIATNCGLDTDCTAATLGSLLGILDPDSIPEKWARPIGDSIAVSREIRGIEQPSGLAELTAWTMEMADSLRAIAPSVGPVAACQPAGPGSPIRIAAETSTGEHPFSGAMTAETFHGHWLRLAQERWQGKAWLNLKLATRESRTEPAKVMIFGPADTRVRFDRVEHDLATLSQHPDFQGGAPSFHRPGRMQVQMPGGFDRGALLEIALPVPREADAELVFGIGDAANNLWIPGAFAER